MNVSRSKLVVALAAAVVVGLVGSAGFVGAVTSNGESTYGPNDISFVAFCGDVNEEDLSPVEAQFYDDTLVGVSYTEDPDVQKVVIKASTNFFEISSSEELDGLVTTAEGTTIYGSPNEPCGDLGGVKFNFDTDTGEIESVEELSDLTT